MEKPIVVIVPSYNNAHNYKRNLDSIFSQNYNNYRVLYFDDSSTDNTYSLVMDYLSKKTTANDKMKVFQSIRNSKQSCHKFMASRMCRDEEIMVFLDGDDWLKGRNVFQILNNTYQSSRKPWVTYGNYEIYNGLNKPASHPNFCHQVPNDVIKNNSYRHSNFCTSHLRTCYAWLYKQIPISHLTDSDGRFLSFSTDVAEMRCLIELAGPRNLYIPQVLYIYNRANANLYETSSVRRKDNPESLRVREHIRDGMKPLKILLKPIKLGISLESDFKELVSKVVMNPTEEEINQMEEGKIYYRGSEHQIDERLEIGLRYMINMGIGEFRFDIRELMGKYNMVSYRDDENKIICMLRKELNNEEGDYLRVKGNNGGFILYAYRFMVYVINI